MTGYVTKFDKVQVKLDSIPYYKFPNCCSTDMKWDFEADLSKKPIKRPIKVIQRQQESEQDIQPLN